jgi:hypothetical protein
MFMDEEKEKKKKRKIKMKKNHIFKYYYLKI